MRRIFSICAILVVLSPWLAAATKPGLPFIDDDYARALSEAKQRNLPLFVEVSAPW
ncbi:MAG TPA: hypothetical protein VKB58_06485 [Terriglobales bacterium]|jgi:hypothetical protein|nr:hypothetical protein [Terriglobales bacterium]